MDPKDTPLNVSVHKLDQIDLRKSKKRDPALAQLPTEKKKIVFIPQPVVVQ